MVALRIALLGTALQGLTALRKVANQVELQEKCVLEDSVEPQFVSDIPEIDNVTYFDQTPPFLITFWAPWCGWSRRFVTNGGEDAPLEQVNRELAGSGVGVLKFNSGGRGAPRVPRPPGFEFPYIPAVYLVTADGSKVRYEGDRDDVGRLARFARGEEQTMPAEQIVSANVCSEEDSVEPLVGSIPEIDNVTFSSLRPPFLVTFWAPWCGWSRRFVTNGGSDAPIQQVHRGLEASGGPAIVTYDVGGRDAPRVPLPPGFSIRGIPTVFKVIASGENVAYEGDPADVEALIAFAME